MLHQISLSNIRIMFMVLRILHCLHVRISSLTNLVSSIINKREPRISKSFCVLCVLLRML
ncbi:hypothetical protein MANES_12G089484v8 [Manihot esculenta]|uniref:Uncharacterized protein n=1 Tax=Manihot esculenta TaxID=3983 RepID=A0ACB7GR81_MANES|nr:hypothetical protein MANES_12G089484v8 [Manihot esculenta]